MSIFRLSPLPSMPAPLKKALSTDVDRVHIKETAVMFQRYRYKSFPLYNQDFSTLTLLSFGAGDSVVGGCSVHYRMLSSILGLCPLASSSAPNPQVVAAEMSPDIA